MERGISQETLAELSDLHRTYISAVESGKRNLTLESIQRLATALGGTVGSFFTAVEAMAGRPSQQPAVGRINGSAQEAGSILLVEDDLKDAEYTLAAFKAAKLANPVQVVRDGAAALEHLIGTNGDTKNGERPLPQMVLLDLHLPKVHGLEVLRRIKANRRTEPMPVIVLAASHGSNDVEAAMRLGASAYLVKPVDFHRFAEVTPRLAFRWALL